jgi:hypothetical protein
MYRGRKEVDLLMYLPRSFIEVVRGEFNRLCYGRWRFGSCLCWTEMAGIPAGWSEEELEIVDSINSEICIVLTMSTTFSLFVLHIHVYINHGLIQTIVTNQICKHVNLMTCTTSHSLNKQARFVYMSLERRTFVLGVYVVCYICVYYMSVY